MNIKFLVLVMGIILFSLYIFQKYYRPKEKLQMTLEVDYIESLKKYYASKDSEIQKHIFEIGKKYGEALGMTKENTLKMIQKDLGQ
tara:strand:+ start:182 stop:439 length:258 start_codon:yes stop_codon:yes gene_type:complete